eukprot:GHVN01023915.1.p1 GENE.GHVN01023915.1~~GHVN01023915.1.p1  ORF type:complete len:193 (-),score=40.76 GHVN01023915.1:47-577(-)
MSDGSEPPTPLKRSPAAVSSWPNPSSYNSPFAPDFNDIVMIGRRSSIQQGHVRRSSVAFKREATRVSAYKLASTSVADKVKDACIEAHPKQAVPVEALGFYKVEGSPISKEVPKEIETIAFQETRWAPAFVTGSGSSLKVEPLNYSETVKAHEDAEEPKEVTAKSSDVVFAFKQEE